MCVCVCVVCVGVSVIAGECMGVIVWVKVGVCGWNSLD